MVSKIFPDWAHSPDAPNSNRSGTPSKHRGSSGVVRVEMGRCGFFYKKSTHYCDCASGSIVGEAGDLSENARCDECDHPLPLHSAYCRELIPPGLRPPQVCPRTETVEKLAALLDDKRILHIRGTPSSGKSTLAGLLVRFYKQRNEPVQRCAVNGFRHAELGFWELNFIFIIDEAQSSYNDSSFWLGVIKTRHGCSTGPRLCLFASYGSPTTGAPPYQYPFQTTPVHLGPAQRVGITRSHLSGSPDVCLFYDEAEFRDAVDRICARPSVAFNLDDDARDYLWTITNGHPGAVNALVTYVHEVNRHALNHGVISSVSKDLVIKTLEDDARVFRSLESTAVFRSSPTPKLLTMPAVSTLPRCLESGTIPCDLGDEGVRRCYELGWLHSDQTRSYALDQPDTICFFPSRLHEKFVELLLYTSQPAPFPSRNTRLSRGTTSYPARKMNSRVPELVALRRHNFKTSFIVVSWNFRIDFRMDEPRWGIELLRDGDRLGDHSVPNTKLWRIVFQNGYASASIVDARNMVVVSEFPLLK
ncbi:uncharacterized protein BDV17DRAFT_282179 [Aspergillus undulatus]|uniref:uncharacterized protein n=1 Tax=Aspergillus undulatus TaxID=1810928 RepID=UPI003CCD27F7